jgi:tryptophanyl-tRNA synthetase
MEGREQTQGKRLRTGSKNENKSIVHGTNSVWLETAKYVIVCCMKRVFSGIQPTGEIHIGNYLGAIRNWAKIGDQIGKEAIFCIVDYHAITIPHDAAALPRLTFDAALANMAAGLDPNKITLFAQSHVREHVELGWVFTTQTPLGELERMTQFKDKSEQHSVLSGLLMYPVLQAADILLYKADTVPVGDDQIQHIELTRDIARRFNYRFGREVFPEPKASIDKNAARVPGLDGAGKMSKSKNNTIGVLEPKDSIWQNLRVAPTDPQRIRRSDPGNPDVCVMFSYHKLFSSGDMVQMVDTECRRAGIGCVDCKKLLMENIWTELEPIQAKADHLRANPSEVTDALVSGADFCRQIAQNTMAEVREAIGLLPLEGKRP